MNLCLKYTAQFVRNKLLKLSDSIQVAAFAHVCKFASIFVRFMYQL